jgi:hypothetical protein
MCLITLTLPASKRPDKSIDHYRPGVIGLDISLAVEPHSVGQFVISQEPGYGSGKISVAFEP